MPDGTAKPCIGEQVGQIQNDGVGFPDLDPVMHQHRHLAFGMRVGGIGAARTIVADNRDNANVDLIKDA